MRSEIVGDDEEEDVWMRGDGNERGGGIGEMDG